jgi:outer membrane protein assembly factor BamD (BamD/ComL family)
MMRKSLFVLGLIATLSACQGDMSDAQERQESIQALESQMRKQEQLDTALASSMIEAYANYIEAYPKDSLAPYYQKKIAEMHRAYPGHELQTIEAYEKLIDTYTYHQEAPKALMSLALYYEEIQERDKALLTYKEFVRKFPSHSLANQARQLMDLLSEEKSDVELVQEWMQKAKQGKQEGDSLTNSVN